MGLYDIYKAQLLSGSGDSGGVLIDDFVNYEKGNNIEVNSEVEKIRSYVFYGCKGLTTVNFPNAVWTGEFTYYGCTNLTTANFPNATSIDACTFSGCTSLKEVNIPKATKIFRSAFSQCTGLTEISLPSTVTSIDSTAFNGCNNLKTITINKTQNSISGAPWGATNATVTWTG